MLREGLMPPECPSAGSRRDALHSRIYLLLLPEPPLQPPPAAMLDALVRLAAIATTEMELQLAQEKRQQERSASCETDFADSAVASESSSRGRLTSTPACSDLEIFESDSDCPSAKKPKRLRVSDLPDDIAARMREVNRVAAKRHRLQARQKQQQLLKGLQKETKRYERLVLERDSVAAELLKLRTAVQQLYQPGGPRYSWTFKPGFSVPPSHPSWLFPSAFPASNVGQNYLQYQTPAPAIPPHMSFWLQGLQMQQQFVHQQTNLAAVQFAPPLSNAPALQS